MYVFLIYMLNRKDIFRKLSDICVQEDPAVSAKIQGILRNPIIQAWVSDLPLIPSYLLTILGSFKDLQQFVSQEFIWEYWAKSLVEEHSSHPDITEIAELAEVEEYVHRFGRNGLKLPADSIHELRIAYDKCRSGRFRGFDYS
jgi:hypothetical protein